MASEDIPANGHGGPTTAAAAKRRLRGELRRARSAFAASAPSIERLRAEIAALVADVRLVGAYAAHRGEPDILSALSGSGQSLALPRTGPHGRMRFVGWDGIAPLVPAAFGIAEPPDGPEVVPDLVLVPLLGFDRAGRRLGQGGGHYDRWFANHPGTRRIGIAWSVQEVAALPEEPWDARLHLILTEAETIRP